MSPCTSVHSPLSVSSSAFSGRISIPAENVTAPVSKIAIPAFHINSPPNENYTKDLIIITRIGGMFNIVEIIKCNMLISNITENVQK